MIIILSIITALLIYIMGFIVGKKYAENEIREMRSGADLDTEDKKHNENS